LQSNYTPTTENVSTVTLKIYAGLAAQALKTDTTAAYGVWTLARAIDASGGGWVRDADLRSAAATLADWDDRKYRRARADAIHAGLMTLAGDRVYLVSLERAAYKLGAQRIGHTPIGVDVRSLAKVKTWRATLMSSFLAGQKPNPIAQVTIEAVTGVTPRTQLNYRKAIAADVNAIHNFARLQKNYNPRFFEGQKDTIPGAYLKTNAAGGIDLWTQLGNTYDVNETTFKRLRPGRTRRAQSGLNFLVNSDAGQGSITTRMYYETRKAASDMLKRAGKGKVANPEKVYILARPPQSTTNAGGRQRFAMWVSI
jgi:hypothetical protein